MQLDPRHLDGEAAADTAVAAAAVAVVAVVPPAAAFVACGYDGGCVAHSTAAVAALGVASDGKTGEMVSH